MTLTVTQTQTPYYSQPKFIFAHNRSVPPMCLLFLVWGLIYPVIGRQRLFFEDV